MVTAFQSSAARPLSINIIARSGGPETGVGRYVHNLTVGLQHAAIRFERIAPDLPLPALLLRGLRRVGLDLRSFFSTYPLQCYWPNTDLTHLTSQNLATLLLFRRPRHPVIVTVHDIIPFLLRADPRLGSYRSPAERWFDRLAMAGLRRADHLLADSQFTRESIIRELGIAPERISVVYPGIDTAHFAPHPHDPALRERYGLPASSRYLLYVGSEDPRKNLQLVIKVLPQLQKSWPNLELIKVGRAHFGAERTHLQRLAETLGVARAVRFLDDVSDADLPHLYGLADVYVMPSLYEGFGFPVVEALACGTPTVAMKATSLPELAGSVAALVAPDDEAGWVQAIDTALRQPREQGHAARIAHAQRFDQAQQIAATVTIYQRLAAQQNGVK